MAASNPAIRDSLRFGALLPALRSAVVAIRGNGAAIQGDSAQSRHRGLADRADHAVSAAARGHHQYGVPAGAGGAAGHGTAAAAAAAAAAEAGEAVEKVPVEKAPGAGRSAHQGLKERIAREPGRPCGPADQIDLDKFAKDQKKTNDPGDSRIVPAASSPQRPAAPAAASARRPAADLPRVPDPCTASTPPRSRTRISALPARRPPGPAAAARPRAARTKSHWSSPRTRARSMHCMRAPCATIQPFRARSSSR